MNNNCKFAINMTKKEKKDNRKKIINEIGDILKKEKKLIENKIKQTLSNISAKEDTKEDIDATVQNIAQATVKKTTQ